MITSLLQIHCVNATNRDLVHHPITYGVPLGTGALQSADGLAIRSADSRLSPVQTRVLGRHPDGSIRWLLLDFALSLPRNARSAVSLVRARVKGPAGLMVREETQRLVVTTPRYRVTLNKEEFSLFESYQVRSHELVQPGTDIVLEDPQGERFYASNASKLEVRVTEVGPLRAVVEVCGRHAAGDGAEMLSFRVRYTFRLHDPCIQVSYRFTNRESPERGVELASIRLLVPTALGRNTVNFVRQNNTGADWFSRLVSVRENVEIIATRAPTAAGVPISSNLADGRPVIRNLANLRENLAAYPYYLRPGNPRTDFVGGLRSAYPYLGVAGPAGSALGWFAEMENHFPKGIAADRNVLTLDIWPAWAGHLTVRRGQSKEHDLWLCLLDGQRTHRELEDIYYDHEYQGYGVRGTSVPPVQLALDPDYVRSTGALDLHRWLKFDDARYVALEQKLGTYAPPTYAARGMFDCGDQVNSDRSWTANNENDVILNTLREYYRRAAPDLLREGLAMARHNAHVDFIAFDPDPLRRGTMPAHCPEHTDGATYPSHMWVGGLLAAFGVSGHPDFLEAALSVGENLLRWQNDRPEIFYGDSRECGWPMLAWLQLHEQTGDRRWLKACRRVFEYFRGALNPDGAILYELPHGVGIFVSGYCEFIAWRAMFFYYERTGEKDVRALLVKALDQVYRCTPKQYAAGGWGCNDLFPAWAAYTLTGNVSYLEDNYPFLEYLMKQPGNFTFAGVDLHYYLNELDRRGVLQRFCR